MKRNLDLCRDIMIYLKKNLEYGKTIKSEELYDMFKNFDKKEFLYQIELLENVDFIKSQKHSFISNDDVIFIIKSITYKGQDFLDVFIEPTVWEKVKEKGKEFGLLSFDIIIDLGKEYLKNKLNL